jgi:O-antigen/teichoic acid export membrane protein
MSANKLAKNTIYLTLASTGQKAVAFVYFALIARYFGQEGTGEYFLALAIVTVIAVLDDLGITSVVIREVAKKKEDAKVWLRTLMGVKAFTMPATVILALLVPLFLPGASGDIGTLVRIAVVVMLADTLSLSFYGVLRGLGSLKYESLGIFVGQSITTLIGLLLILTGTATLQLLIIALIAGSVWNMLFSAFVLARQLGVRAFIPNWTLGWKPLKVAFAFFLAAAFVKVYSYVDSFVLLHVMGEEAVGVYAIAYKLTYAFQFLPLAFVAALYPAMSEHARDKERLKEILLKSFWYMAILAAPIVFGIWAIAPELVTFIYSTEFVLSILPLQILIFVLIFIFLDFPMGSLLNATDRQALKTTIGAFTMVINVVVNLILIPKMGIAGASIAALVSFMAMLIMDWYVTRSVISVTLKEVMKEVLPMIIAGAIMALCVVVVKQYIHFILTIPIGAIVYLGCLWLFGSINQSNLLAAKRMMKR